MVIDGEFPFHLETGRSLANFADTDMFRTFGRLLQPGERLVITFEGG